jgi:predicted TIM-barrel fold metal-dependent hydrolase
MVPIEFGPISNGEYLPALPNEVVREAERRLRRLTDDTAPRLGMSRRDFLRSSCGTAAALFLLAACHSESNNAKGKPSGGTFKVPKSTTTDTAHAQEALGGNEFVFDVQTHLLEFDTSVAESPGGDFAQGFPYAACGEGDWRECFGIDHWFREMFVRSDTTMAVISAVPILANPNPLSIDVMERARTATRDICGDDTRVFLHGQVNPNVGEVQREVDHMREVAAAHPVAAWKVYTHVPAGRGWYLDDHDPNAVQCGAAFLDAVREIGPKIVCVHKGLGNNSPYSSPIDIGPVAKANPDITFVVYHSGYDSGNEGAYSFDDQHGINRLITSLDQAGIKPHSNVYAELGSTWFLSMRDPTEAAHVLGKLINRVGVDRVLWGTDSIWYGSPQSQIEALRTFQISDEFQERYNYPSIDESVRRRLFGLNAAELYGVDKPVTKTCKASPDALAELRAALPPPVAHGPRTAAEAAAVIRAHGGVAV